MVFDKKTIDTCRFSFAAGKRLDSVDTKSCRASPQPQQTPRLRIQMIITLWRFPTSWEYPQSSMKIFGCSICSICSMNCHNPAICIHPMFFKQISISQHTRHTNFCLKKKALLPLPQTVPYLGVCIMWDFNRKLLYTLQTWMFDHETYTH